MTSVLTPPSGRTRRQMFKPFLAEKRDPAPFYEALATQTVGSFPFELAGMKILDLGCGPGHFSRALSDAGATVLAVDFDPVELASGPTDAVAADAHRLPLADGAVDGVFCSNMLEHAPGTPAVFDEIARVLKPGGWAWVSWTNWYSPWGGHEITPFHYLGPRLGLAAYRSMKGEPRKNVPGEGLFPVHIGSTLALLRRQQRLRLMDAYPRYYPSQRWIVRVPGVREVFTWNCVLLLERVVDAA